jgi:beta-alanine degradation protein BauB
MGNSIEHQAPDPNEHASFRIGTRLLFENDRVRVWELRLAPGERSERHRHQADFVSVNLTRSQLRLEARGEPQLLENAPGFSGYHAVVGSVVHSVENIGPSDHVEVIVELKGPDALPETESAANDRA